MATCLVRDRSYSVTSQSSDKALAELAAVESPDSPVRAVVSVNMLKEGWDVKNIGVIVGYRALASSTLTEQVLGRGLRLPFGSRVGVAAIDHVDLVAHGLVPATVGEQEMPSWSSWSRRHPSRSPLLLRPMANRCRYRSASRSPITRKSQRTASCTWWVQPASRTVTWSMGLQFLILSSVEAAKEQLEKDQAAASQVLYKVKDAPAIIFPRRERELAPVMFSLSFIAELRRAGCWCCLQA